MLCILISEINCEVYHRILKGILHYRATQRENTISWPTLAVKYHKQVKKKTRLSLLNDTLNQNIFSECVEISYVR